MKSGAVHAESHRQALHQQMIPALYLPGDRREFDVVMIRRRDAGRTYKGY